MIQKVTWCSVIAFSLLLAGCSNNPLRAPCDQMAHFCGTKAKINQW